MQENPRSNLAGKSVNGPVEVPVKADSSDSNPPIDPEATLIEFPKPSSPVTGPGLADPAFTLIDDTTATLVDVDATLVDAVLPKATTSRKPRAAQGSVPLLETGDVLAGRYEILQLLGEGGMGAVYKAQDRELDRFVALKLVRPELAANPAMIARFKRELLLSHQVTHKNVIRIYDLGDSDGMKFISMEFVEGEDLRSLILEKKKFSPEEAVDIIQQVCRALEAAHGVGVIHRDLKPQNIMQDKSGRILVMDFGMARTLESDGMTQTGALVGTMEYMSPEQALAGELDQRSDIFAVGLILYELLTGKMPFKAESAVASLIKRTTQRAAPISEHDAAIPQELSNIVSKCLERDVSLRYQNAGELLRDLDAWQGGEAAAAVTFHADVKPWGQTIPWPLVAGIAAVVVLAIVGFVFRGAVFSSPGNAAAGPAVSLAILPFHNGSGDASMDWLGSSFADMLSTDIGQSAQVRTVSPSSLHQIFTDLRISPSTALDPGTIKRVAEFSNAQRVVWGQYAKFGDHIRIDATLQDLKNDRSVPLKIEIASEKEIPGGVDKLAESIREKLSLPGSVLKELKASSFQPQSSSVEALRDYDQGIGFQRDGRNLEARQQFEAATKADSNFALAFSRLGQSYSALGYDGEAEQSAQKAVTLSQDLPEAEKYLIAAIHSQVVKNYPDAIKAYEALAKVAPDNYDVEMALAGLYKDSGDLTKAREYYQKLLTVNPKDPAATLELGRLAIIGGDAQGSLDPLNRALSLAIQVSNDEQKAASLHFMAVAYGMLNKSDESIRNEEQAIAIWRNIGQKRGLALSLNELARAQASFGKRKEALANFDEALQIRRDIGDKRGLGDTLIDMGNFSDDGGDHEQALKMYKEALQLERDLGNESMQAVCLTNIGSVYTEKGQYDDALTYFQQTLQLREKSKTPQDIVEAVHNLGEVSTDLGQYDQAISYYVRALDLRRGMNDLRGAAMESYSLGTLFDYQGRFGAAVNSKQDALKIFRDLNDKTFWMAEMLGGAGEALILAGRGDEAKSYLDEGLALSRELKNDGMLAQTLGFQGNAAFYRGDFKSAQALYTQALQAATRSKEPDRILIANSSLAKVMVEEKRSQEAVSALKPLIQKADDLGLKYISVECSIFMAEAMLQKKDRAGAKEELKRALLRADQLGVQPLSARAHFLSAVMERESGDASDAQQDYRETIRLLDGMKKDPGAQSLFDRADFKAVYEEATQASAAKS